MTTHKYLLQREGAAWLAAAPGYLDPSEGPVGRGATPDEAIESLTQQPEFQLWLRENGLANPTREDFALEPRSNIELTFVDARGQRHVTNPSTEGEHGAQPGKP